MLNVLWFALLAGGLAYAAWSGHVETATAALFDSGLQAIKVLAELAGLISIWFGISRIAERAGLIEALALGLGPFLRRLFPDIPARHPALAAMLMNLAANVLGLGNAATPFGLKAMQELQQLNPDKESASPDMITFLAVNSACVTIIPATTIALRQAAGAKQPADVVLPAALATCFSLVVALAANALFKKLHNARHKP